ncbi:hypothetical protein EJP77_01790 [Paenibacillus zeisoli]|uniref:Sigma-54 factor interaction domain-containing protein n=1 Tax=Paenibacillus zeisoli TaxID=2496267 RepID=A0A3S1E1F8_9BACL|nr:sigma 54-interacting transcriptional regulator [Paenibacillus zeisoli]RUT35773.1 hypothetical protein EJP77_01790 [Paenibacillus zeisoli]
MNSKYFELLLNARGEAIVLTDEKQRILYSNRKFSEYFNLPADLNGSKIGNLIDHSLLEEMLSSEKEVTDELFYYDDYLCNGCIFYGLMSSKNIGLNGYFIGKLFVMKKLDSIYPLLQQVDNPTYDDKYLQGYRQSAEFQKVRNMAKRNALNLDPVLIKGRSDIGKSLVAKVIHSYSERSRYPFFEIDCHNVSAEKMEHLLFGQAKGSFMGKIVIGDKGTIFLNHIDHLPLFLQQKLLDVIKSKSVRKWNTKRIDVDLRFIFGTSVDLQLLVEQGIFNEELYFRISNIQIEIPELYNDPLSVEEVIQYHIAKLIRVYRKVQLIFEPGLIELLNNWNWQGDEQKMIQTIDYLIYHASTNLVSIRDFEHAKQVLRLEKEEDIVGLSSLEREQIKHALGLFPNKTKTAEYLGIGRATLYRKIEKYKL